MREAVEMYLTWETFEKAVGRAVAGKAVGTDGFGTYALKHALRSVRVAGWEEIREAVDKGEVPRACCGPHHAPAACGAASQPFLAPTRVY